MDGLKLLIDKLSQYNFLTNILPGSVLCVILKFWIGYDFISGFDWYVQGVIFYFVGMVNNRFGSLVLEWLLRLIKFVKFAPYKDFVLAEKKDSKITTLSMENNIFRTYLSVMIMSLLAYLYKTIENSCVWIEDNSILIVLIFLAILFAFSYRKQTKYVKERVEVINKD